MRSLVWFRRDLRLTDNPALFEACKHADEGVVGLFVITPQQWKDHDDSEGKVQFWLQNLRCLSASLQALRIPLRIVTCKSYDTVPDAIVSIAQSQQCSILYFNREYEVNESRRDDAVVMRCGSLGMKVRRFHDRVIVPPTNIETKEGRFYTVFTPYRRVWDQRILTAEDPLPPPTAQTAIGVQPSVVPQALNGFHVSNTQADLWKPGEDEAHSQLARFAENRIGAYGTGCDLPSVNGTSVLSPYLAAGIISPRQCLAVALSQCDGELSTNPGAATWVCELTWRDFYTHVLVGFPRVSMHQAFNPKNDSVRWRTSKADFDAWCEGRTGYPLVDAGMRQLNQTGWMHNRLRMVTAMFLTKHLLINWRWGERYFMNKLIDGDLAANNGGWQWSASTGTDSVPYFRIFNPFSQSKRFDTEGVFIKRYCPELSDVTPSAFHDAKKLQQEITDRELDYPRFVVDYKQGRQRALAAFKSVASE